MKSVSIVICFIFLALISGTAYSQDYESEIVLQTQRNLQKLGYNPGPLDGIWGKKTQSALKEFQHDNALTITGKLDSVTKEKLGIISSVKKSSKREIPLTAIVSRVRDALEHTWQIRAVQIENQILRVVADFGYIDRRRYALMILEICRHTNASDPLVEIWVLNARENQGWVLLRAESCCNQTMLGHANHVDKLILSCSADILLFRSE